MNASKGIFTVAIIATIAAGCGSKESWRLPSDHPPTQETDLTFEDDSSSEYGYYSEYGYSSETSWVGQWGEVVLGAGGGVVEAYTGFVDWDGQQALCDVAYLLEQPTPVTGCPDCSTAVSFVLGTPEISADVGGRCDELGWLSLEGTPLVVGHAEPESLWQRTGGNWSEVGWSAYGDEIWEFERSL